MSRYVRGRLKQLRQSIPPPEAPSAGEARARVVGHLEAIAQARRSGTWTEEQAGGLREAVRLAKEKRGLVDGSLYR